MSEEAKKHRVRGMTIAERAELRTFLGRVLDALADSELPAEDADVLLGEIPTPDLFTIYTALNEAEEAEVADDGVRRALGRTTSEIERRIPARRPPLTDRFCEIAARYVR